MENYRDNLVVIFAGYTKEMDAFLKSNTKKEVRKALPFFRYL